MAGHSVLKPHGYAAWTPREGGPAVERDTLCCVHCGLHFYVSPGSGKIRGYCMKHGGATCGQKKCDSCVHRLQKLENLEHGLPEGFTPIIVAPGFGG